MKQYLKFLMLLILSIALIAGINSCGKESSGGIEPTPVNPTPNNGGGGGKTEPDKPDDKPIGDGKVNVFEQVVAVQESEITSVKSDTAAHHYTITYNNDAPEIKPGNVVVVNDNGETRIILVTDAKIDGNTAELDGPLGDLSYVFFDTEFILTNCPDSIKDADCPVYTPTGGTTFWGGLESGLGKNSRISKKGLNIEIEDPEFKPIFGISKDNQEDYTSYGMKFGFEFSAKMNINNIIKPKLKIKNTNELMFKYYHKQTGIIKQRIGNKTFDRTAMIDNGFSVLGSTKIEGSIELKMEYNPTNPDDFRNIVMCNVVDKSFTFNVGIVPVVLNYGMDILADVEYELKTGVNLVYSNEIELSGELGMVRTEDGEFEPIIDASAKCTQKSSCSAYGKASLKAAPLCPFIYASLVDKGAVGLGLKIKPQLVELEAGANFSVTSEEIDLSKVNDNCGISLDMSSAFYLEAGLCHYPGRLSEWFENWFKSNEPGKDVHQWEFSSYIDGKKRNGKWEFSLNTDGKGAIEIGRLPVIETPYGLTARKISSVDATMKINKDYDLDTLNEYDTKKKNIVYFPVRKNIPVTIDFRVLSRHIDFDLKSNFFLQPKSVVGYMSLPGIVCLKSKKGNDWIVGSHSDYVWIPDSDDDFLEAAVYDCNKNLKGYCKIMNRSNEVLPSVTAIEDSKIAIRLQNNVDLKYMTSTSDVWVPCTAPGVTLNLKAGQIVWFKGNNPDGLNSPLSTNLNMVITGNAKLSGNIMGLINSTDVWDEVTSFTSIPEYCFKSLFEGSTGLSDASKLDLPVESLSAECYNSMFKGCTKLAKAPKLPATKLADACYGNMFEGCKKLNALEVSFDYWSKESIPSYGAGTNLTIDDAYISFTQNWLKDVAKKGDFKCPSKLSAIIGDSFVPKGWTMNGKVLSITVSVDLPDILTVITGDDLHVTGSASDPCTVIVEVDGSTHQTIKDATAFTINLPTDVIGNHSVKVYVAGQTNGAKTFSYKVEKKPDTPATGNTSVPSVPGSEINNGIPNSSYAPNVNGQNVNSEYNSGGNTPSVKGQNLDQYYNGGGSTPDIKGTNL